MPDREAEKVDEFIGVRSDKMGAKNFISVLVYNRLRALLASGSLRQTDGGNRRQCEGRAWHAAIVGPKVVAFKNIGGHDLGFVAGDWRQRRTLVELDPKYVDVIVQRWQSHVGEKAILAGDERNFDDIAVERVQV